MSRRLVARATAAAMLASTALALTSGCATLPKRVAKAPASAQQMPVDTISTTKAGTHLTVTGAVETVMAANAFVVQDADDPNARRLVLGSSAGLYLGSEVTVTGEVTIFDPTSMAPQVSLNPTTYEPFAGHRVLVANHVQAWP